MRIQAALVAFLIGCTRTPADVVELPLVEVGRPESPTPSAPVTQLGRIRIATRAGEITPVVVRLVGLQPTHRYVLCLNPEESGSPTSDALGRIAIAGWPPGEIYRSPSGRQVGHWNFATITTDAQGAFEGAFDLPLRPLEYRVRLLVKTTYDEGSVSLLQTKRVEVSVLPSITERWLAGTLMVLPLAPLLWFVRLRRRKATARPAPRGDTPDTGRTRIERARAEGVIRHSETYTWIEIHGRRKRFRPRQALVFRILCEQDPDGLGVPQETIVRLWEASFPAQRANPVRVHDIFRAYPDEPGDFIVRVAGAACVYRLRLGPEQAEPPPESLGIDGEPG